MTDPVMELLRNLREDVHSIKGDLSSMLEKHDKRIDDLENGHAQMSGAVRVVIAIAAGFSGILSWVVSHIWKV